MTIDQTAREIAASRRFREWLESKCDDHNWPQPISGIVAMAEHFYAHESALRAECERLVREWQDRAYAAQKRANLGIYPEGNCAEESAFNDCAIALAAVLSKEVSE